MITKTCNKCGEDKELSLFWKDKNCKYGHRNVCINCEKKIKRERYLKNKDEIIRKTKKYRENNLEKDKAIKREYYLNHREETILRAREWQKENAQRRRESQKKRRLVKPDLARNGQKKYRANNKEKGRFHAAKRRSRIKNLPYDFTNEEWEVCLNFFGNRCAYCGADDRKLEHEHLLPTSKGGPYSAFNIIPSCKQCNSSKWNREYKAWYKTQSYYTKEREERIKEYVLAQIARAIRMGTANTKYQQDVIQAILEPNKAKKKTKAV